MRAFMATVVAVAAVTPQIAVAAPQSGVHVDPGSPAGKQYAIPITSARTEAAGNQPSATSSGSQDPPLFGVGVKSSAAHVAARKARRGRPVTHADPAHVSSQPVAPPASPPQVAPTSSGSGGGSAWIALAGGGVLVLALGGAGGLALRRRLS
jgi:hypothetical protein